ncbi:MAG TPA: hypothetical protein VN258_08520, partial [Mobilitalea sp.]|nr:hypothetical protein [Mobilitalea sp.]
DVDKFHQNEMRKITINTIIFLKDCYPQNKKINFVTFHNELMWGVNSNYQIIKEITFFHGISMNSSLITNKTEDEMMIYMSDSSDTASSNRPLFITLYYEAKMVQLIDGIVN